MLRKLFVVSTFFAAVGWCAAVDAAAQPALTDHRLMVSEHTSLPITCTWEFSDGTAMSGLNVRRAFARPGRYKVHFHAANSASNVSKTFDVAVLPND